MPGSLVEEKAMLPYLRAIFQQFFPSYQCDARVPSLRGYVPFGQ
jgi:hypothetical protein